MEIKCPTCGVERTVDAASNAHAEEQMCEPCASSYKALLAEIEARASQRKDDDAPAARTEAPTPILLAAPHEAGDRAGARPDAAALDAQDETDSDGYALGVSLYRVPAAGLAVCAVCLFALLFLAGWLRPAGAAQPASVLESAAAAQPSDAQDAADKVAVDPTADAADAEVASADEMSAEEVNAEGPAEADEVAAGEESAEEIDEAQFEKEEAAEEAGEGSEDAPAQVPAKSAGEEGRFTVQVGSYNQPGEAEARATAVHAAGFEARVVAVEIPGKGTWYRVQAGRFGTREQAALYEKSLRAAGAAETTFVAESAN